MRAQKKNKTIYLESTDIFSRSPMEWYTLLSLLPFPFLVVYFRSVFSLCSFEYLQSHHLISELTPHSMATYLRTIPHLNKVKVGNFLGKKDPFNSVVLKEYPFHFLLLLIPMKRDV